MQRQPKIIIVSAPSGSGKTTLVKHLLSVFPSLAFSISATSRKIRNGETNGKDYYFMTEEDFRLKINSGELLEWQEVYTGNFYGSLRSEVERLMNEGRDVVFDVDVVGGLNIKKEFGSRALALFIQPPSVKIIEERLKCRNTDSPETIKKRVDKATTELTFAAQFDHVIINNDLEQAKNEIVEITENFLNQPFTVHK